MTLTLEVSQETARRIEWARAQGINIETLLCNLLEHLAPQPKDTPPSHSLRELAGKYEGEAWDELLREIERNRREH